MNLNLNRQKSEQNNSRYIYLALSKLKTSEIYEPIERRPNEREKPMYLEFVSEKQSMKSGSNIINIISISHKKKKIIKKYSVKVNCLLKKLVTTFPSVWINLKSLS